MVHAMRSALSLSTMLLVLQGASSWCQAQTTAVAPTAAAAAVAAPAPARLMADIVSSRVYIKVTSGSRLGHDHGVVGRLESGVIQPGGGGQLVFAMNTFVTDTPEARKYVGLTAPVKPADQQKSSANMLGPDVLNVQRFPRAAFVITAIEPADGQAAGAVGTYDLRGNFTLHGVTRPLTIRARLEPTTDPTVQWLRGAFAIQQSQYGITPYSALGGLVSIEDRLEIWGEFVLRQPVAAPTEATR